MSAVKPPTFPDWATDHTIETTPGDPEDPNPIVAPSSEKIGEGWLFKEKPAFNFFNWLGRLTGDWIRWFERHGKEHVHDGATGDLSAPKVHLKDHIAWSDHDAHFEVTLDDGTFHAVQHKGATTFFQSGTLSAVQEIQAPIARVNSVVSGFGSDPVSIPYVKGRLVPVAWAIVSTASSGSITTGVGFSAVEKITTGTIDLTFAVYDTVVTPAIIVTSGSAGIICSAAISGTKVRVLCRDTANDPAEPSTFSVVVMGLES
jgi:hypothetical protein